MLGTLAAALAPCLAGCETTPRSAAAVIEASYKVGDALAKPAGYKLVWADEFGGEGLPDATKWKFDTARNSSGWYNQELQYYSAGRLQNSRLESGRLIIEARKEDLSHEGLRDWGGQSFSSARIGTRGKGMWHRGYFEIRARLPCIRGAWPAIWLLPDHQDEYWSGGEIDIAEVVGFDPGRVHHSVQTPHANFKRGNHHSAASTVDPSCDFHTYQLYWTAREVVIGTDGRASFVTSSVWLDRPMALLLNVAVGGTWAGSQGIDEPAFPARMEVDFVRIYQGGAR